MSPVVRRKGERFTLSSKYILFILTILCILLMILSYNTTMIKLPLNSAVGYIFVPFQEGIATAGNWINRRMDELEQINDLLNENARLQAELDELLIQNTMLQEGRYELNSLRELYELDDLYDSYPKTGARIIGRETGNWYHTFTIDKGTDDGMAIDMNVLASGGLVGRITEVGKNWAKVTSIIADNAATSGMILSTGSNLIVYGELNLLKQNLLKFDKLLDQNDLISKGDKVVTSNISDKYLPNILIGYVHSVELDANILTKSGYITPVVDFEHIQQVLVITTLKQIIE